LRDRVGHGGGLIMGDLFVAPDRHPFTDHHTERSPGS
jgi:hypothetical protein